MVRISKALSPAHAIAYFTTEFANGTKQYFSQDGEVVGHWRGPLAAAFGVEGAVELKHFARLMHGRHPLTGEQLVGYVSPHSYVRNGETIQPIPHRAGWDVCFSSPKSVSLVGLVGHDDRVLTAHRDSVDIASAILFEYIQARMGGDRKPQTTGQYIAAQFEHNSSRPVNGRPSPQIHTHVVLANVTVTAMGKHRALQPWELYKAQAYATAIYRGELAIRLKSLGYDLYIGDDQQPEIVGLSKAYLDAESPRTKQIHDFMAAHGLAGAAAMDLAAQMTREPKAELTKEEVQALHQQMASEHGFQAQKAVAKALASPHLAPLEHDRDAAAQDAVTFGINRQMERTAVFQERDGLTDAMVRGMGYTTFADVRRAFNGRVSEVALLERVPWPNSASNAYTTPDMVTLETEMLQAQWRGQQQHGPLISPTTVAIVLGVNNHLNPHQRQALEHVLGLRDQVVAINGRAGAGKTVSLATLRSAAECDGYVVQGLAPTSMATINLAAEGRMKAETLQLFLTRKPDPRAKDKRLIMLDEASLASSEMMHGLFARLRPTDRVVLVGDSSQHQSVDAGMAFEQLKQSGMHGANLPKVIRQADAAHREIVTQLARGQIKPAIAALHEMGSIHEIAHQDERMAALAADVVAHPSNTLVLVPDNDSRHKLNTVIHDAMQAAGRVSTEEVSHQVLVELSQMQAVDKTYATRYQPGDVLRYTKGSKKLGLAPGSYATVTGTNRETNSITVQRATGGRPITYDPAQLSGVSVARYEERAFAVGDRVQFTMPSRALAIVNRHTGTITALEEREVTVRLDRPRTDGGKSISVRIADFPHVEFAYALTSPSAQSLTRDRLILHIDAQHSAPSIVNQRLAYTALSRAKYEMIIYTDSYQRMLINVERDISHRSALEPTPRYEHEHSRH
jgi:conjugative relaxase-like TrwC/TraI family protein